MIISHKNKYIFIHCRKAAGSSIDSYLSSFFGPNDLMLGSWCDSINYGNRPNRRFYRELLSFNGASTLLKTSFERIEKKQLNPCGLINHSYKNIYKNKLGPDPAFPTATILRDFIGDPNWSDYYKFTIVRNSYQRIISDWIWRKKICNIPNLSFRDFLYRIIGRLPDPEGVVPVPYNNWNLYTIDDEIVVDYVGFVDRLDQDLPQALREVGIYFDQNKFPHAKKANNKVDYRSYYTSIEYNLVNEIFSKEIEAHSFRFE